MESGAAPALGHPCLIHPSAPVEGTCARCGKFYCRLCLEGIAFAHGLADVGAPVCTDCKARLPATAPTIDGLLAVPALHLVITTGMVGLGIVVDLRAEVPPLALAIALGVDGAHLLLCLWTMASFFRRKKRAINLCLAFYVVGIAYALIGTMGEAAENALVSVVGQLAFAIVWIVYFLRSKRVQATFVID